MIVAAEKSSALTEISRPTNRSSLVLGSVSSLSNLAAAATSAGPVGDGVVSLASHLVAMTTNSTTLSNAASSRSLASLQALASASMMDKSAAAGGIMNDRLKLESVSLESILPTLNGPAIAVSSVSIGFLCLLLTKRNIRVRMILHWREEEEEEILFCLTNKDDKTVNN